MLKVLNVDMKTYDEMIIGRISLSREKNTNKEENVLIQSVLINNHNSNVF